MTSEHLFKKSLLKKKIKQKQTNKAYTHKRLKERNLVNEFFLLVKTSISFEEFYFLYQFRLILKEKEHTFRSVSLYGNSSAVFKTVLGIIF